VVKVRRLKGVSISLLAILLLSVVAAGPALAAEDTNEIVIADGPEFTKVQTDDYSVIFPRNGTKPMFIWWWNNHSEKVYVVHFKGLIEYATIDGGDFSLANLSEAALFNKLVKGLEQEDSKALQEAERAGADVLRAGEAILTAMLNHQIGKDKQASDRLEFALSLIEKLNEAIVDADLQEAVDGAVDALEAAIAAIEEGGDVDAALEEARGKVAEALSAAIVHFVETVRERLEAREWLADMAKGFHPALLNFNSANWTISEILPIVAGGNTIGYNFTMNLTDAPHKFEFAEGNISLAIRLYNTTVVENYEHSGKVISYNVTDGEMKMDLIINDWAWNFEPQSLELPDSQSITISPALALWVDASCFNASGERVEKFFTDLELIGDDSTASSASFKSGDSKLEIQLGGGENDAKPIKFKPTVKEVKIAGKSFGMASAATITFDNETLGGFFEFVPYAIQTGLATSEIVPVSASYFARGNHIRIYIQYPYFTGSLVHDPSIGVMKDSLASPAYLVGMGESGTQEIKTLPALLVYPTLAGAVAAALLTLAGAALFMVFSRRHPTLAGR
jgi:hypothetical protein